MHSTGVAVLSSSMVTLVTNVNQVTGVNSVVPVHDVSMENVNWLQVGATVV